MMGPLDYFDRLVFESRAYQGSESMHFTVLDRSESTAGLPYAHGIDRNCVDGFAMSKKNSWREIDYWPTLRGEERRQWQHHSAWRILGLAIPHPFAATRW